MAMAEFVPIEMENNFNTEDKAFEEMSAPVDNGTPYVSKRRLPKTKEKESLMMWIVSGLA